MSDRVVLDASALLALMLSEPGAEVVDAEMPGALLCAVNRAEVVSILADRGVPADRANQACCSLGVRVIEFDALLAGMAGALRPITKARGLSLGDRSCLALAQQRSAVVLTADHAWLDLADRLGLIIRNIRLG